MSEVDLKLEASTGLVVLEVPGLQEGRPSLLKGDKMYLREAASNKMVEYEAFVHQVGEGWSTPLTLTPGWRLLSVAGVR